MAHFSQQLSPFKQNPIFTQSNKIKQADGLTKQAGGLTIRTKSTNKILIIH